MGRNVARDRGSGFGRCGEGKRYRNAEEVTAGRLCLAVACRHFSGHGGLVFFEEKEDDRSSSEE